MGKFFDSYTDEGGGAFLSKEEKQVLIEEETRFPIISVSGPTETKYGPRFVVGVEIEGETRLIGFKQGVVFSRDRMLTAMQEHLEGEDAEPPEVILALNGRSQILVDPDAEPSEGK